LTDEGLRQLEFLTENKIT